MRFVSGIGNRKITCLDWDSRSLRIVNAAVGKGGARILGVAEVPIPPDVELGQADSFGAFLRGALRSAGARTDAVIIDVPRQDAVLNSLMLPPTEDHELANMVRFQVAKELPFSLEQGVVDFVVLRRNADGKGGLELLVAAVRNHVVEYYRALAEAAGIRLDRVGLRPYANMVAIMRQPACQQGRVVLVDVGPQTTEIDVFRDGRLAFSRGALVTIRPESAPPDVAPGRPARPDDSGVIPFLEGARPGSSVDELLVEVTRTVEAYRASDAGATIDRVIVAGSTGIEDELSEAVARRFRAPASIYRPPDETIRALERRAKVSWSKFGAALGLAWGHVRPPVEYFNFLDPKQPVDIRKEQLRKVPIVAGSAGAVLLIAAAAVGWHLHGLNRTARDLAAEIAAEKEAMKTVDEFIALVSAADAWRKDSVVWLDELHAIAELLPPTKDAYLRELNATEKDEVVLSMLATSDKVLADFCERLGKAERPHGGRYVVVPMARLDSKEDVYKVQQDIRVHLEKAAKPAAESAPARTGGTGRGA